VIANIEFAIDGRNFFCDADAQQTGQFEVKSMPRAYSVIWNDQTNPFASVNALMAENPGNILLIDGNVFSIYRDQIVVALQQMIAVPATETFKTVEGVCLVFDFLYQHGFTKDDKLIVVGGGIVQDVGAFTAACYKRGIKWVYFPTTLLAMCDSCIGGKSGINYKDAKNQMALFSAPSTVVINPQFLTTLSASEIKSGLGEILKLFIMGGESYLLTYQQHVKNGQVAEFSSYKTLILTALAIKRAIVEVDEFECNYRKGLNYGHTLGHAIEVMSEYAIAHGIAVTIGMIFSNELSCQRQLLPAATKSRLNLLCRELLDADVLQLMATMNVNQMLAILKQDKKATRDQISFVVVQQPGDTRFIQFTLNDELHENIEQIFRENFQFNDIGASTELMEESDS
jgi:3-dehydroquinate synthase